jgi:LuxR family transcriptional regulator, maltose regulon positive regulatory protein
MRHRNAEQPEPFTNGTPKTFRPSRRPELTSRNRILADLAGIADDVPLIVMVAPPGYGKTTVLSQWAARDPRPFVWVRLEESDNDPSRLLRHIALGMHRTRPV